MAGIFIPLWPAIIALFISHGFSFVVNFLGRKEHEGAKAGDVMNEPYKRVFILQVVIIFGCWMVMLLKSALPALMLLILLKTCLDLRAHRQERIRRRKQVSK